MQPMSDSVEGPARKRTRVEDTGDEAGVRATEATEGSRKRDDEFWFEDGTVILVACDVEFRIYKGLLAHHSPVFRDMFSLPQPPDSLEADSPPCSVVPLSDSPEDLRYVLRVYMTRGDLSPFTPDNPSFDLISACIRLGHKYQMTKLLDHSVAYLKSWYPADMEAWQKHWPVVATYVPLGFKHAHAIGVVNLARLTGESSILPTALLDCCNLDEQILDGFDRADGSHEGLAPADLRRCLSARPDLAAAGVSVFARAYRADISEECTTTKSCRKAFHDSALALIDDFASDVTEADPFKPLPHLDGKHGISLCSHCLDAAMARGREEQRRFWEDLPSIFDIEVDGWGAS